MFYKPNYTVVVPTVFPSGMIIFTKNYAPIRMVERIEILDTFVEGRQVYYYD